MPIQINKLIEVMTYGCRHPTRNAKNNNIGERWLRNGPDGGSAWETNGGSTSSSTAVHGGGKAEARFMEVDGIMREISGDNRVIKIAERNIGMMDMDNHVQNQGGRIMGGNIQDKKINVVDLKWKRVDHVIIMDVDGSEGVTKHGIGLNNGPKNL